MHRYTFPSLMKPAEIGYTANMDRDILWDQAYRVPRALSDWTGYFLTYGDGTVQHSHESVCTASHFADYCASLAAFLLENPAAALDLSSRWHHDAGNDTICFLLSLRFKEGKRQWYSRADRKVSAAPSKANDRRWDEVPDWADGSAGAAYRMLTGGDGKRTVLEAYALYHQIWEVQYRETGGHNTSQSAVSFFGLEDQEDLNQAFRCLDAVFQAARQLDGARRCLDCWKHNARVNDETVA